MSFKFIEYPNREQMENMSHTELLSYFDRLQNDELKHIIIRERIRIEYIRQTAVDSMIRDNKVKI